MGESPEAIADGTQEALMPSLSSVNIACGAHAGDEYTMKTTIEQAMRWNLAIGAHPGYRDPANFGRLEWNLPPDILADSVFEQVLQLAEVAARFGARLTHVKPHGALYNQAARDVEVAKAVAFGVSHYSHDLVLFGLAGSPGLDVFHKAGFTVAAEAFVDRRYEPDGSLRSRKHEDALIRDPAEAARQAVRIAEEGTAQTICIHSDTPGAPEIAAAVAAALRDAGITLRPVSRTETHGSRIRKSRE
jgi:UPF0271 protein